MVYVSTLSLLKSPKPVVGLFCFSLSFAYLFFCITNHRLRPLPHDNLLEFQHPKPPNAPLRATNVSQWSVAFLSFRHRYTSLINKCLTPLDRPPFDLQNPKISWPMELRRAATLKKKKKKTPRDPTYTCFCTKLF